MVTGRRCARHPALVLFLAQLWLFVACDNGDGGLHPGASADGPTSHPSPDQFEPNGAPLSGPPASDKHDLGKPQSMVVEKPRPIPKGEISFRAPDGSPRPFVGMTVPQDQVLDDLRRATPTAFRPVGSTSTVFKMDLDAPYAAAFKSATHARPNGPAAEVAAYRLSRCLGLNNVPPAISRRIPLAALQVAFQDQPGQTWAEVSERMLLDDSGAVLGVAIYWIPDMVDLGIDGRAGVSRWANWLRLGESIPEASRPLAAHISTMLVFDYLVGNFDRFSGGNARGDVEGKVVFLRDHDVTFPGRLSKRVHRRVLERMLRAQRFSRSFYRNLVALNRACFVRELAHDPAWEDGKLLHRRRIDGAFERKETAKSHIESLIQLHGEEAILIFP